MVRQTVVEAAEGRIHLQKALADYEAEPQGKPQHHPELLPLEELGVEWPLLVVGREPRLPPGAVDLVGTARNGAIVVIDVKTGPQYRRHGCRTGAGTARDVP